jgi:hypothetical protein
MRKLLRKKIDNDSIELLTALFERLERYEKGVDGEGFRIKFKDRRTEIDELLARSFIRENYEPTTKIYRPTLLALSLIDDARADEILVLVDRLVRYFAQRYETTRSQAITLKEMSEALATSQDAISNALGYIIEGPASGGRSSGLPDDSEWFFRPGSNSLDFPSLDPILAQLAEWAGRSATIPNPLVLDYLPTQPAPYSWIRSNWKVLVGGLGGIAALRSMSAAPTARVHSPGT